MHLPYWLMPCDICGWRRCDDACSGAQLRMLENQAQYQTYKTFPVSSCSLNGSQGPGSERNTRRRKARLFNACSNHLLVIIAIIGLSLLFMACAYEPGEHNEPVRAPKSNETCHWCIIDVPEEQKQWPAVGYDLTESYGTATVKFPSGEIVYIGPIEGDASYKAAMHKLSLESSKHTAPPYEWYHDPPGGVLAGWYDIPRRTWRSWRKNLGFPATYEVGCIASLLSSLLAEANSAIQQHSPGQKGTKAVITSPDMLALYDEDIYDIAEYAGLDATETHPWETQYFPETLLSTLRFRRQPKYIDSAFMGYGLGLCEHPESDSRCKDEEAEMPNRDLITVYVSRGAVDVECPWSGRRVARTDTLSWQQHVSYFDDDLGLDSGDNIGENYWFNMHTLLLNCMDVIGNWRYVTDVLLVGEMAGDERVEKEVIKAVKNRPQVEEPRVYKDELPVFVPSRGAAEMAARILWTPEGCGFDKPAEGSRLCRKG